MEWADKLPVILVAAGIILVFYLFRRAGLGGVRNRPNVIQGLLYDVRLNQALVETFYLREKPKKFDINNWKLHGDNIDFLEESLQNTLSETFGIVEELNQEIRQAKKLKTKSHLNLDTSKLKGSLARSRKGLEDWMMDNIGSKELPTKYPSLFGWFLGDR